MVIKKKRQRNRHRDTTRDYVNGPQLQQALVEWYDSGKEDIPREIITAIFDEHNGVIARLGTSGKFSGYSYLDEMKADAQEMCVRALMGKKYKAHKYENPFAYFTTVAYNAFVNRIKREQKENYVKHKNGVQLQHELMLSNEEFSFSNEASDDVISSFEEKQTKKSTKKKEQDEKLDEFYE